MAGEFDAFGWEWFSGDSYRILLKSFGNMQLSFFGRANNECSRQTPSTESACGQCSRLSGKAFSADPTHPPVAMFLGRRPVPRQAGFG